MKTLSMFISTVVCVCFLSCSKETDAPPFTIEGIAIENYPRVDGSTSTSPLNIQIACQLLGYKCQWEQALHMNGEWHYASNLPASVFEQIKSSQTHNAFVNLINDDADLIISARRMSDDEKALADEAGVTLIEKPIALDAFIFMANTNNRVNNLSIKQIQNIYTGEIRNWKEVGGKDKTINPYVRNANSGSQELMETMVMKDLEIADWPEQETDLMVPSMSAVINTLAADEDGIGYTVFYYKQHIMRSSLVKSLTVNGIVPDKKNISNRKYPLIAEVYLIIRSDLDENSMAYKLYELLLTDAAKPVINASGYIAY